MKIRQYLKINCFVWTIIAFFSCTAVTSSEEVAELNFETIEIDTPILKTVNKYTWLADYDVKKAMINQIPTPKGYKRTTVEEGSYADWLRFLPLQPKGSKVYLYNGEEKNTQDVHHAVLDIDIGKRDLQQCADAVMRLKAEYHYSKSDWKPIHFNFTSGDRVAFDDWRKGRKPVISGNSVRFTGFSGGEDNSYANFKKYLTKVFTYAGTASLSKEMKSVAVENMEIGDVFIVGGFPGHAMIVLDMAENEEGKKVFLLGQSYMPAQNIHVLRSYHEEKTMGPWYSLNFGNVLTTPEFRCTKDNLMRFEE